MQRSSPEKRPNIFDLEKISGFSRSTISRAFKPDSTIKDSTRKKILAMAAEAGYAPHPGARMIRSNRMHRWGLLVPNLQNPYYAEVVEACNKEARSRGTSLILGLSNYEAPLINELLRQWAGGETDGLIIDSPEWTENGPLLRKLRERHVPMVFLHDAPAGFHVVRNGLEPSLELAMGQLLTLGHRHIAYIGKTDEKCRETLPYATYQAALGRHGMKVREEYLYFGSFSRQEGFKAWQKWRALPNPPTAVLAFNDVLACGVWRAAQMDGRNIPKDLSLIGNDDIAEAVLIGLTTTRADVNAFAHEIFDVLDASRANPSLPAQRRILPTDFIVRSSVAPPRVR